MNEVAFGIIPLRQTPKGWEVFLVQHQAGHWAFPKGRPESEEPPLDTAKRELTEETGLKINELLPYEPLIETYQFDRDNQRIDKKVKYFLAKVAGEVVLQESEIARGQWCTLQESKEKVTYSESKQLCEKIEQTLAK